VWLSLADRTTQAMVTSPPRMPTTKIVVFSMPDLVSASVVKYVAAW